LRQENEKLVSSYKATGFVCASTSLNMDDYKSLQSDLSHLLSVFSYLKDLFRKMSKGKSDLSHLLSVQKHTTDKTGFLFGDFVWVHPFGGCKLGFL